MKIMPIGDYYSWECPECHAGNVTLWTRMKKGNLSCGKCSNSFPLCSDEPAELEATFSAAI